MKRLMRRDLAEDRGSIILALLGIVILTTVASVGLAAVVNGQKQSRHDNTFASALDNAATGLDAAVALVKEAKVSTKQTLMPSSGVYQNVTATPTTNLDSTGNPGSTTWDVVSTGLATAPGGNTISRTVEETVTISHTYRTPVYGATGLGLGQGSSINDYDAGAPATPTQITGGNSLIPILPNGLIPISVNVPQGTPGAATVGPCTAAVDTAGNCLQVAASDAQNFSQIVMDSGPAAAAQDTCSVPVANAGGTAVNQTGSACGTSTVVTSSSPPPTISTPCGSSTTVALDNTPLLAIPTGITGITLGLNVPLTNPLSSALDVCSALGITIPSLSALTAGLVNVPIGFPPTNCVGTLSYTCTPPAQPLLGIYATGGSTVTLGSACVGAQTGTACPLTVVDAIVADQTGNCQINGNVMLFGAINCNTITFSPGAQLTVEYPNALKTFSEVTHVDYVDNWNEQHHG